MAHPSLERRRRRSSDTSEALALQLEACRRDAGLDAMILADDHGLCIATSGDELICAELAARLSVLHRNRVDFGSELWTEDARWDVHVRRFDYGGMQMTLCAVGGLPDERAQQIVRSLGGVTRILQA
ncbi:hypothetical protein [Haliangium ochraceum]|uniref:Roadblock/LC7 family protein n=1 Tax=Haliangium ochraceum (strain DSM 14365 / JCM 11303 / SMP-2) TaxID=502025 RepID=D0LSK2_HALO1|nr:hypothetical protein [Haliangium ochraceum]ACY15701.1 conserved hypothetical protein [Haliangium ochraceum DSM 14365]